MLIRKKHAFLNSIPPTLIAIFTIFPINKCLASEEKIISAGQIGILAISPGCSNFERLETACRLIASSETITNHLIKFPQGSEAFCGDSISDHIQPLYSDLEHAQNLYYSLNYHGSIKEIEALLKKITSLKLPAALETSRWNLYERSMSYLALSHLGLGHLKDYEKTIKELAATRGSFLPGSEYPPGFRKSLENAVADVAKARKYDIAIKAKSGIWHVSLDGCQIQSTPHIFQVSPATHYLSVEGPDGISNTIPVHVSSSSINHVIDPYLDYTSYADTHAITFIPQQGDAGWPDLTKAPAAFNVDSLIIVRDFKSGLMLTLSRSDGLYTRTLHTEYPVSQVKIATVVNEILKPYAIPAVTAETISNPTTKSINSSDNSWYKQWWFWTIVASAAAVAVGVPLYYQLDGSGKTGGSLGTAKLAP